MRWIAAAAALILAGCPGTNTPCPGDEQMGTYIFHAEIPDGGGCDLSDLPKNAFEFTARFCRFRDGGDAFVSIGGVTHVGTWDGQTLTATYSARRNFAECSCFDGSGGLGNLTMTETISVALLSSSQSDAAGGECNPNDPTPRVDLDAGITPPGTTEAGKFDAVKACGTLGEELHVDPKPTVETEDAGTCKFACDACLLHYTISGDGN